MANVAQIDVVPEADLVFVEADGFVPTAHLVEVLRADGGACICGTWFFMSSTCGHPYRIHDQKCGAKSAGRGNRSAYCPQTSGRILYSNVKVNANCVAASCQAQE